MFGFYARGNANHLILGDDNPVLCQKYRGRLVISRLVSYPNSGPAAYGYCEVTYSEPIKSLLPPMVFGVPTISCDDKGIGFFQHRGQPGNWTGFSIACTMSLYMKNYSPSAQLGFDTGWEYRVCVFGDPGVKRAGASRYGLALFDGETNTTFNSNWPFVPFRGLLSNWNLIQFTRSYDVLSYWFALPNVQGSVDYVLAIGSHQWAAKDGDLGLLISSLGCVPVSADIGRRHHTQDCVVMMGFIDSRRETIKSVTVYGMAQHPSANMQAINNWRILTADFTYV